MYVARTRPLLPAVTRIRLTVHPDIRKYQLAPGPRSRQEHEYEPAGFCSRQDQQLTILSSPTLGP